MHRGDGTGTCLVGQVPYVAHTACRFSLWVGHGTTTIRLKWETETKDARAHSMKGYPRKAALTSEVDHDTE